MAEPIQFRGKIQMTDPKPVADQTNVNVDSVTQVIKDVVTKEVVKVIKKKIPEWVILLITNVVLVIVQIILQQVQGGQIKLELWAVNGIALVMSIVRMFNKTEQDKVIIASQIPAVVSTDVPTVK